MTPEALALIERTNAVLDTLEARAIVRVDAAIDRAYRALEQQFIQQYQQLQSDGLSLTARARTAAMLAQLAPLMNIVDPEREEEFQQLFEDLINQAGGNGAELAGQLMQELGDETVQAFSGIPIEAVALQARDASRRLYGWNESFRGRISGLVEQGLIQGWGARRVAEQLQREVGIVKGRAETIARTETMSALNDAAQLRYEQAGVEGVQWVCTIGEVCPFCVARNMKVYPVGKIRIPAHPRCRCIAVPWRPNWDTDDAFTSRYRRDRLADLRQQGGTPNNGLTPFERAAGLTRPPRPIFNPSSPQQRRSRAQAQQPQSQPAPDGFPSDVAVLEDVRDLGGSTGAQLVRDPARGREYVLKRGDSAAHLREEFAADEAYRALGVNVPRGRLYETPDGPVKLSEFIEGEPLSSLRGSALENARSRLREDFAVDALLGNWDVVGLNSDNILVGADGRIWRIDNGGALRYRAQGASKGDRWNDYPTELFSLRDSLVNPQSGAVFGSLRHNQLIDQIERLGRQRQPLLDALPTDLRARVGRRLDEMERVARISRTLEGDRWVERYQERFVRHGLNLRSLGIVDRMPTRFDLAPRNQVYDQDGRLFDHLRGSNSIVNDFADYVRSTGGDYQQLSRWMSSQGTSSWSPASQALKAAIAENRGGDTGGYFWLQGTTTAEQHLQSYRRQYSSYDNTLAAYHAFNYELMSRVEMPNNDLQQGVMRIYRTESIGVLQANGVNIGSGQTMVRGAAESASAFTPVEAVAGNELTIQEVPHHRIIGAYFQSRAPGGDDGAFLGDDENEIVFIPDGIEFEYTGENTRRQQAALKAQPNYQP